MILKSFTFEDWKELEDHIEGPQGEGPQGPGVSRIINWNSLIKRFKVNSKQNIGPLSNLLILAFQVPFKNIPVEIGKSSGVTRMVFSFRLMKGL